MAVSQADSLLDSFAVLADATRCRMLRLLDRHELTVSELCSVLQLPQSTMSRQLKTLADADWVTSRREGTSRYYSATIDADTARGQLWDLTRGGLAGKTVDQDARRLAAVLARRSQTSREFFASAAGQWDRMREEMFGAHFAAPALLALLPHEWTVADLGCGTGAMVALVAPHVRRVIGVDASAEMLTAARVRTADFGNVDLRQGALEALPLDDASVDAALFALVLHHLPSPPAALAEAARVVKPEGRLLVIDMAPHDHEEYRQRMGHVWLGFADDQLRRWLQDAGFTDIRISPLPAADAARGPALVAASASRPKLHLR